MSDYEQFNKSFDDGINVRGFLHRAHGQSLGAVVLTHGAGGNANGTLLLALSTAFAEAGFTTLRCDLPFRQLRPHGPPSPSSAARDQLGLRHAAAALRDLVPNRIFVGGQSYGGRQASLLAASDEAVCDGLLLLSYPLHPPGKAGQMRTQHFPEIKVPTLFVQGSKDPFGSVDEMQSALKLLPVAHEGIIVANAGHDLGWSHRRRPEFAHVPATVLAAFRKLFYPTK